MPNANLATSVTQLSLGNNVNNCLESSLGPANLFLRPLADVNYFKIVEFASPILRGHTDDEETVIDVQGGSLLFKPSSKSKKIKLENITKEQWFAASLRILDKLLISGQLKGRQIPDYLAYLIHVTDLAQQYQWSDVLLLDDAYRREQAKLNCPWGTPIATLERVWLQPKGHLHNKTKFQGNFKQSQMTGKDHKTAGNTYSQSKVTRGPIDPKSGKEICIAYNNNRCKCGLSCRYVHVCSTDGCGQSHSSIEHTPAPNK
jgi:hypothetical protein